MTHTEIENELPPKLTGLKLTNASEVPSNCIILPEYDTPLPLMIFVYRDEEVPTSFRMEDPDEEFMNNWWSALRYVVGANEGTKQIQDIDPTSLYVPLVHARQTEELLALAILLYVPEAHVVQEVAPVELEYVPRGQGKQAELLENVPMGQADVHTDAPDALKVPAEQGEQKLEPSELNEPAGQAEQALAY
jgi:hypothetical protein